MALADLDINKIRSFTYSVSSEPQTFVANGQTVTGNKRPIEQNFVELPDRFTSKTGATPFDNFVGDDNRTQTFTVNGRTGQYIVTGIKGAKSSDIEVLKSNSLIIKSYDEALSEGTMFNFLTENPTMGFRQIPFGFKDLGIKSLTSPPERFVSPQVRQHNSMTRGGLFTDPIVEHDQFILSESGILGEFKASQLLLQADAIQQDGLGLNQLFNSIQFDGNLNPGTRVYRHGVIGFPVPRYAPQPGPNINPDGLLGLFNIDLTRIENAISDNLAGSIPYEDIGKGTPKILGLYNSLMLHQTPEKSERSGFFGGLLDTLETSAPILFEDPYPIVPSINVVNSPSTFDGINQAYHKDSIYGTKEDYVVPAGRGNIFGANLVSEKYDFFSKSKPTVFKIRQEVTDDGSKSKFADAQESKIDSLGSKPKPPLESKIKDRIPLSVGGKDYDVRASIEANPFQQIDKTLSRGIPGQLNKFSTLSYSMLGAKDNADQIDPGGAKSLMYDKTLRSPSEINLTALPNVGGDGNPRLGTQEIEDSVNSLSGPRGDQYITDNLGARDHYQKKVYAIGKQGVRAVLTDSSKKTNDAEPFRGVIRKGGERGDKFISDAVDRVNILPYGGNVTTKKSKGPTADELHNSAEELDFVPLVFEDVYNKKSIVFRSVLGDITDTITPDWTQKEYIGRPQKAAVYKGVGRTIGFNFSVYPKTKQEFPVLLEKVNYLVGQCYPNLDKNLRQTGPMIRLTIGDILYKQLGYITACTVTFPNTSTWELDPGLRFTKLIQVQIEYTHIGGYVPVATGKHYGLPWLRGGEYNGNHGGYSNYPNRESGGGSESPPGSIQNYRPLFQELGQQDL